MADIAYKLTDRDMRTFNGFQWTLGEWVETSGEGGLCGHGWIHLYDSPLLAALMNPVHGDIEAPRLWRAEAEGKRKDDLGLKHGRTRVRLVEELPEPMVTLETRVRFGILCAAHGERDVAWRTWARDWIVGSDRSWRAAEHTAAGSAARAALWSAAQAAAAWSTAVCTAWSTAVCAAWSATESAAENSLPLLEIARAALSDDTALALFDRAVGSKGDRA